RSLGHRWTGRRHWHVAEGHQCLSAAAAYWSGGILCRCDVVQRGGGRRSGVESVLRRIGRVGMIALLFLLLAVPFATAVLLMLFRGTLNQSAARLLALSGSMV